MGKGPSQERNMRGRQPKAVRRLLERTKGGGEGGRREMEQLKQEGVWYR